MEKHDFYNDLPDSHTDLIWTLTDRRDGAVAFTVVVAIAVGLQHITELTQLRKLKGTVKRMHSI